jgi:hypothetical protein
MSDESESSTTTVTTVSTPPVVGNVVEATSLIAAVATLISSSTATIMARLDALERGETTRWRLHDEELERNRATITAKFEKIETELAAEIVRVEQALEAHLVVANAHFAREHDDDLVMQARIRPVRTAGQWIVKNWKTIALVIALITTTILAWVEGIEHTISDLLP